MIGFGAWVQSFEHCPQGFEHPPKPSAKTSLVVRTVDPVHQLGEPGCQPMQLTIA